MCVRVCTWRGILFGPLLDFVCNYSLCAFCRVYPWRMEYCYPLSPFRYSMSVLGGVSMRVCAFVGGCASPPFYFILMRVFAVFPSWQVIRHVRGLVVRVRVVPECVSGVPRAAGRMPIPHFYFILCAFINTYSHTTLDFGCARVVSCGAVRCSAVFAPQCLVVWFSGRR